ncbi:MAG: glutaredoxin family protein [Candidatus Aminicenantes bacterium]|nr:glutaredoxin family protein [Candidatus Aminicenantes bacterium]
MIPFTRVKGKDCGKITFYGLSTCAWCRRTRHLLDNLGVAYDYVYVDLLSPAEQEKAMENVRRWNPNESFPTLVFNDSTCVLGFDEERIRAEVGK